jgi:hypothetical protein
VSGVDASLAEGNGGALVARLAEVWAPADEARMRELDRLIAEGGHEREKRICPCGCLAPLGECAEKKPLVSAATRPARPSAVAVQTSAPTPTPTAPAQPAAPTETPMSCPECKSPSRHRTDCSRNPEKSAATAKPAAPAKPAPIAKAAKPPSSKPAAKPPAVRVARAVAAPEPAARPLEGKSIRNLVEWRAELVAQIGAIDAELKRRQDEIAEALGSKAA